MSEMINPYIAGAPVTERTMFFGRQDVFGWVQRSLTGKFVDHILVIHGQRRVGKTSVLKQIPFHLPPTYIPVFFDLQGRTHTTIDRFLWRLAKEITRTLRTTQNISLPAPSGEDFSEDPEFFQNQFLPQLRQAIGDRRLLLIFDEFDSLEEPTAREMLGEDLIPYFSRLMHAPGPLAFVFSIGSSGRKLEHMQSSYTDFFRTALYKKISFLEKEEAFRLITQPVTGVIEYDPEAVKGIFEITSGHPYFTQLLCHELFGYCHKTGKRRISPKEIDAVLDDVVERGTVNLKFVWDDASDPERYVLAALSLSKDGRDAESIHQFLQRQKVRISQREVTDSLRHLQEKDVLASDNSFTVDLMRLWLLENKPVGRVIEELTEVSPIATRFIEIAQEFHETGMADEALNNYRRALEVDPQNLVAQVGIASLVFESGDLLEAGREYEKALEIDPEDVAARSGFCQTHLALGDELREGGKIEEALEHYRQVLSVNEQHLEARERLAVYEELAHMYSQAQAALRQKRYDRAVRLLRDIVTHDVSYRNATRLLAQAVELQREARPLWKDMRVLAGTGGVVVVIIIGLLLFRFLPGFAPAPIPFTPTPVPTATPAPIGPATATAPPRSPTPTPSVPTPAPVPLSPMRTLEGHTADVVSVAFSPDGSTLASGSYDNAVRLWRVSDGAPLYTLGGHTRAVWSVAFSPDGEILASGSDDQTVLLSRASDGALLRTLQGHTVGVSSVAFSPDGTMLASGSADKTVIVWYVESGDQLRTLEGHTDAVMTVAFSPDGTMLASGSADKTVIVWDVETGDQLRTLEGPTHWVNSVAFSPDGQTLASGSEDELVRLWRVADWTPLRSLRDHTGPLKSVAFSSDGAILAEAGGEGVFLWDMETGQQLRALEEPGGAGSVAFSPDGRTLASGFSDGTVQLLSVGQRTTS